MGKTETPESDRLSSGQLALKLAIGIDPTVDWSGIAEASNCIPEGDPREKEIGTLVVRVSSLLETGSEQELREAEFELRAALMRLLQ